MDTYKWIYVLGSGFSKSISKNMPAMSGLSQELRLAKDSKYPELMDFMRNLDRKTNGSKELTSMEAVCSLILGRDIYYNSSVYLYYQILQNQLVHWLYEKIDTAADHVDADKVEGLKNFIMQCACPANGEKSLVITFNYDLLIERLFASMKDLPCRLDYIIRLNSYFGEAEIDTGKEIFPYLKLHGSFNWFRSPGSIVCNTDNVYLTEEGGYSRSLIHHNDIPVFVPMTFSKQSYLEGSFFNVLWNIAQRYLEMAEEIVFIGYGFPVTDLINLAFFLNYKDKIKHIVIKGEEVIRKSRLEALFGKERIVDQDAVDYLSHIS
ncbi:MAG: SIR2 family protein [Spirochaetia bacterium]|nr:SIR2 family protein [Spirochaetia bacterium]